jgi:hypothetical protein
MTAIHTRHVMSGVAGERAQAAGSRFRHQPIAKEEHVSSL